MWFRSREQKEAGDPAGTALAEAQQNLERAKARTPEVFRVARQLRVLREENHFREQLEHIMGGPS